MKDDSKKLIPFTENIDTEGEFLRLCRFLSDANKNKQIILKRDSANSNNLRQIIHERPTIIHISCHGDSFFDPILKKTISFLAFEDVETRGMLSKYDEDKLQNLLGCNEPVLSQQSSFKSLNSTRQKQNPVKLVFVSACHSEIIGQLFKRAGVPIVIAVNQQTKIANDIAGKFTKHFYDWLVKGFSPKEAYDNAITTINDSSDDPSNKFSCCCAHKHNKYICKWFQYATGFKSDKKGAGWSKACELHTPDCSCPNRWHGKHYTNCAFYIRFHETLKTGPFDPNIPPDELTLASMSIPTFGRLKIKLKEEMLCCCACDSPHDETQKFMILEREKLDQAYLDHLEPKERESAIQNEAQLLEQDREALCIPLFPDEQNGDGDMFTNGKVKIKDDISELYHIPSMIDDLKVIGRNLEVQQIVAQLDYDKQNQKKKLIHIYGQDGVGKTAIAMYAAKYAFDRRFFKNGAYYIDLENKTQEHQLIDTICECLSLDHLRFYNQSLTEASDLKSLVNRLIMTIKKNEQMNSMLMVFDNCKSILSECRNYFIGTLCSLLNATTGLKIIVITDYKLDLFVESLIAHQWSMEIQDLKKSDAAHLLWAATSDFEPFKQEFKNKDNLEKHKFFANSKTFKPHSLIQVAHFIKEGKTLDNIVKQQEEARLSSLEECKIKEGQKQLPSILTISDEVYCWTTNMTFREVHSKYPNEIKLLYVLCQFPSGVFHSDLIQYFAKKFKIDAESAENFIQAISFEIKQNKNTTGSSISTPNAFAVIESGENEESKQQQNYTRSLSNRGHYRIVTCQFIEDMQEYHYIPLHKFTEYINSNVLNELERKDLFLESLKFISIQSRSLLRGLKHQNRNIIDLQVVSSHIDYGIWSDLYTKGMELPQFLLEDQSASLQKVQSHEYQSIKISRPDIKYRHNEVNFMSFLDLKQLRKFLPMPTDQSLKMVSKTKKFETQGLIEIYMNYVTELCTCACSILVILDRFKDSLTVIQKAKEIVEYYNCKFLRGLMYLIEASILISHNCQYYKVKDPCLKPANTIFNSHNLDMLDGIADYMFLTSISFLKSAENRMETSLASSEENMQQVVQRQYSQQVDRSTSFTSKQSSSSLKQVINRQISNFSNQDTTGLSGAHTLATIQEEINQACINLRGARDLYGKNKNPYGIGKTNLLLAQIYIEKSFGTGLELDFDRKQLKIFLKEAISIFRELDLENFEAKSLRLLAEFEFRFNKELYKSKKHIEEARLICERISDNENVKLCGSLLNEILHQIRIESHNVFIFAKAFPLVEKTQNSEAKIVGSFTRHPNEFRTKVKKGIEESKKLINVKFDNLNRELLEYIRNYGCRVLHISSDVFREDCLCIEGKNGEIEYLTLTQLETCLRPPSKSQKELQVDVVVLAIPNSLKIAQVFVKLGVPHVVAFNFKDQVENVSFMDNIVYIPRLFNKMYNFCVDFYLNIIKEKTILEALKLSCCEFLLSEDQPQRRLSISDGDDCETQIVEYQTKAKEIFNKIQSIQDLETIQNYIQDGPILLPSKGKHTKTLFNCQSGKKYIRDGALMDTSRIRGPTNILKYRPLNCYTGHHKEMYKLMSYLKKDHDRIINIFGISGIGKTRFVLETAYYLYARSDFQDGIFITDIANFKTVEQIKSKMKESNIFAQEINSDLQRKNMLLIFDNIDTVIKHNKTQFDWFLVSLVQQCPFVKVIVTSKKQIKPSDYYKLFDNDNKEPKISIIVRKMKPLNVIEAADLVLSKVSTARLLTMKEITYLDGDDRRVHDQLQQEDRLKKCYGVPSFLEQFADLLKVNNFHRIQISHQISKSQKEMLEEYWNQQQSHSSAQNDEQSKQQTHKQLKKNVNTKNFDKKVSDKNRQAQLTKKGSSCSGNQMKPSLGMPLDSGKLGMSRQWSEQSNKSKQSATCGGFYPLIESQIIKEEDTESLVESGKGNKGGSNTIQKQKTSKQQNQKNRKSKQNCQIDDEGEAHQSSSRKGSFDDYSRGMSSTEKSAKNSSRRKKSKEQEETKGNQPSSFLKQQSNQYQRYASLQNQELDPFHSNQTPEDSQFGTGSTEYCNNQMPFVKQGQQQVDLILPNLSRAQSTASQGGGCAGGGPWELRSRANSEAVDQLAESQNPSPYLQQQLGIIAEMQQKLQPSDFRNQDLDYAKRLDMGLNKAQNPEHHLNDRDEYAETIDELGYQYEGDFIDLEDDEDPDRDSLPDPSTMNLNTFKSYVSKQSSITTSSGQKSDQLNKHSNTSGSISKHYSKQVEAKLKKVYQSRRDNGPKSNKHQRMFQKKTKNQLRNKKNDMQSVNEDSQEQEEPAVEKQKGPPKMVQSHSASNRKQAKKHRDQELRNSLILKQQQSQVDDTRPQVLHQIKSKQSDQNLQSESLGQVQLNHHGYSEKHESSGNLTLGMGHGIRKRKQSRQEGYEDEDI